MHEHSLPAGDRDEWADLTQEEKEERRRLMSLDAKSREEVVITAPAACWAVAEMNGWHNPPADLTTDLLLIHSEISEACEALRHGRLKMADGADSVEEELADTVIRVFHTAEKNGFDIIAAIKAKHLKNKSRSYRHGNKAF